MMRGERGERLGHGSLHRRLVGFRRLALQRRDTDPAAGENPLLRPGLALAGGQRPALEGDDGILTAAAQLDLHGTQRVTGLGRYDRTRVVRASRCPGARRADAQPQTLMGARRQSATIANPATRHPYYY